MTYNTEERIGVYSIAKIFTEKLGWIFREQPINDFGIDGFVEITRFGLNLKDLIPTGKLLGVQIKSGKSFFKEAKEDHFVFRGSKKHLVYWLNHALPVVVIIYDKETSLAYWEEVNESTILLTNKSFKVKIYKKKLLDRANKENLISLGFFKDRYEYRLWQLQTSINEINLLQEKQLFLYIEINSIPKSDDCHITMLLTDESFENYPGTIDYYDCDGKDCFYYNFYLSKSQSLKESINDALPWADLFMNKTVFSDEVLTEHIADEILSFGQDEFMQDVLDLKAKNLFLDLAFYIVSSYGFRLELKANDLAHHFLAVNEFLSKEPIVKERILI